MGLFEPKFQENGWSLGIFFGFYKTRRILLSDSANCTVLYCGRLDGLELVTRLSSRPDAFCGQFPSRPEFFSFLVLLAYTMH